MSILAPTSLPTLTHAESKHDLGARGQGRGQGKGWVPGRFIPLAHGHWPWDGPSAAPTPALGPGWPPLSRHRTCAQVNPGPATVPAHRYVDPSAPTPARTLSVSQVTRTVDRTGGRSPLVTAGPAGDSKTHPKTPIAAAPSPAERQEPAPRFGQTCRGQW